MSRGRRRATTPKRHKKEVKQLKDKIAELKAENRNLKKKLKEFSTLDQSKEFESLEIKIARLQLENMRLLKKLKEHESAA